MGFKNAIWRDDQEASHFNEWWQFCTFLASANCKKHLGKESSSIESFRTDWYFFALVVEITIECNFNEKRLTAKNPSFCGVGEPKYKKKKATHTLEVRVASSLISSYSISVFSSRPPAERVMRLEKIYVKLDHFIF